MADEVTGREISFVYGRYTTEDGQSYEWTGLMVHFLGGGELTLKGVAFDAFGVAVLLGKIGDAPGQQDAFWEDRDTGVSFMKRYLEPRGLAIRDDIEYTAVCKSPVSAESVPWEGEWRCGELGGRVLFCTTDWDPTGPFFQASDRQLALAAANLLVGRDEAEGFNLDELARRVTPLRGELRRKGLSR